MPRIIFHIDVNSAFVSWLGAKLVQEGKPDPSVVSGDPSDRRSIVTAASIPAKMLAYERKKKDDALVFTYPDGEAALKAAKSAIKGHPTWRFNRVTTPDGKVCFEIVEERKVLERHIAKKP